MQRIKVPPDKKKILSALRELPKLYGTEGAEHITKVVKLFNASGIGTWKLIEFDEEKMQAFGMCELQMPELGYVSIEEMFDSVPMLELDEHFTETWKEIVG